MIIPVEYHERRLSSSEGYGNTASSIHDPYIVPSDTQRKAAAFILEALIAMANDDIAANKDVYTTTSAPLRSLSHSRGTDGPDVVLMLLSAFVLIGLIFVIGIFISLLR